MDPELEEPEDEGLHMGPGNFSDGGNNHEGNGVGNPPIGVPRGIEPGLRGNPQPQPVRRK